MPKTIVHLVIEPSPLEKDMLWVSTDDGKVHITKNGGSTWTDVSKNIKGLPSGSWIPQIKASNKNKGEALLIANDYRRFNYTPYAYRTTNYGKTWERIVDENDVESYTLSIIEDIENPNLLFLGTDDGLYISINKGNTWTKWTEGFPTVSVKDLVIHPREHDLIIGTFGRAAWVLDDIRPLRAIANNQQLLNSRLELFKPPTAYLAAYQQPSGSRFGADALYNGENRNSGAQISYFVTIDEKTQSNNEKKDEDDSKIKKNTVKWDSLTLKIYDGDRLIRTLKQKAPKKTGIQKWRWNLTKKGPERPSRTVRTPKNEPSGVRVKPGIYKIALHFGDKVSEEMIKVELDPRLDTSIQAVNDVYKTAKAIEEMTQLAADATKQLAESKQIAEKYQSELKQLDREKYKTHIKASKAIVKEIDTLMALFLGKEDKRQGIVRSPKPNISRRISLANSYVTSRQNGITATEKALIAQAKTALQSGLDKTNTFFNEAWKGYKDKMNNVNLSPFKETKSFKLQD
ncbi:hypothetical protein JCM19301_3088 [Jejuia pallidilutea]|uniref:Sortilin N-terminal domain-containing protein n=1 Tax=Jejuia pallidilutea TaxID=504487 RepID=A0A090VPF0_9FLAO|nr:hypothetical protein JCM19301_3088 [Jejuia pallidilutea]